MANCLRQKASNGQNGPGPAQRVERYDCTGIPIAPRITVALGNSAKLPKPNAGNLNCVRANICGGAAVAGGFSGEPRERRECRQTERRKRYRFGCRIVAYDRMATAARPKHLVL